MPSIEHRDPSARADRGDEWRPVASDESGHPGQRADQDGTVLLASESLCGEHERRHPCVFQGRDFRVTVPDRLVLRDDDPAALAHRGQPLRIWRIIRKVVGVRFDVGSGLAQRLGDNVAPQVAIDEEDKRQAARS